MRNSTENAALPEPQPVPFVFGSKAETLARLTALLNAATIPPFHYFTLSDWRRSPGQVMDDIVAHFGDASIAVRSSALIEDGANSSMAGAFLTKLKVDTSRRDELGSAIEQVAQSMTGNPRDQVLVQVMAADIAVSGVIMTYDLVHGAPYYCIDFDDESGQTDTVTSGNTINKGLFVYRHADMGMVTSPRVSRFLELARELEMHCGCAALDIEFGLGKSGKLYLFQVRRIALSSQWHPVTERRVARQLAFVRDFVAARSLPCDGIVGSRTILAIMPDWNPAELIGTTPRPLSVSLYRHLITESIWAHARGSMGYRPVRDAELMVVINNHPYIDVRLSFNSFLPAGLSDTIGEKLVNAWLDRMQEKPELHDKVEFDIVPTCLDFCFAEDFAERYPGLLHEAESLEYHDALRRVTRACLDPGENSTLTSALNDARTLGQLSSQRAKTDSAENQLSRATLLLGQCRRLGTLPFAIVARHAFIAEALLRSAVRIGALTPERHAEFKRSVRTVTGNMVTEYAQVCQGKRSRAEFLGEYGHLRPGTYEVTSLRYDERDDLFMDEVEMVPSVEVPSFALTDEEHAHLKQALTHAGLDVVDPDGLLQYARQSIAGREHVKFIFTRVLSDALSALLRWGEQHGLSRDDLSYLEWPEIAKSLSNPPMDFVDRHFLDQADTARRHFSAAHAFRLGHIIFGVRDIYVATLNRSTPNFVGLGSASGAVIELTVETSATVNINNCIVCIENADPGFDWIFTKAPAALVTRFGGANSHMAIRCAEFGLPAAIGCGDQLFQKIVRAGKAELNCAEKTLRPSNVH